MSKKKKIRKLNKKINSLQRYGAHQKKQYDDLLKKIQKYVRDPDTHESNTHESEGLNGSLYGIVNGTLDEVGDQFRKLIAEAINNPLTPFLVTKLNNYEVFVIRELIKTYSWPTNVYFNSLYL